MTDRKSDRLWRWVLGVRRVTDSGWKDGVSEWANEVCV
jgi:hypothetical protein